MKLITDYVMLPKKLGHYDEQVEEYHKILKMPEGPFSKELGWMDLPIEDKGSDREKLLKYAKEIRETSNALVVVGVGGSYIGARAIIEAMERYNYESDVKVYFLGNNLSDAYTLDLLRTLDDKEVAVNVVSKSGETVETVIGLHIMLDYMKKRYKDKYKDRIYITTDGFKGALRAFALKEDFKSLVFPRKIGGRFSVLTEAGLLPMAVAGVDIDELIDGARCERELLQSPVISENDAYKYAVIRKIMGDYGKDIELLVSYEPRLKYFSEWWKQLFAESEGKESRGLFPSYAYFSTDLHSLGQLIQEGKKNIFETVLFVTNPEKSIKVPEIDETFGEAVKLSGKDLTDINKAVFHSTLEAHAENGIPNIVLQIPEISERHLGELIYFFELSVAMSGLLLKVNPFNQPGVEVYKEKLRQRLYGGI